MSKVWKCPKVTVPDYFRDMTQREHILIGGATGSGKSVALETFIFTLLEKAPHQAMLVLIDPKGVELIQFADMPHTLIHATEMEDINKALLWMEREMDVRYERMAQKGQKKSEMGDIYIIIDEYACIGGKRGMASKSALNALARIAFKGRASNIHIVACTQRPTREVIDGLIADNFSTVLALRTKDSQGSRNLIGTKGCEDLPLYGKAYYDTPTAKGLQMVDVPKVSEEVMETMLNFWREQV